MNESLHLYRCPSCLAHEGMDKEAGFKAFMTRKFIKPFTAKSRYERYNRKLNNWQHRQPHVSIADFRRAHDVPDDVRITWSDNRAWDNEGRTAIGFHKYTGELIPQEITNIPYKDPRLRNYRSDDYISQYFTALHELGHVRATQAGQTHFAPWQRKKPTTYRGLKQWYGGIRDNIKTLFNYENSPEVKNENAADRIAFGSGNLRQLRYHPSIITYRIGARQQALSNLVGRAGLEFGRLMGRYKNNME